MSVPQLVDKTRALVSTKLDARGLDELRLLLDMPNVPDENLLALVESMQEAINSEQRFDRLVERVNDVSRYYDMVEPLFRKPFQYLPCNYGVAQELTPNMLITGVHDLFSILSEGRPHNIGGLIAFSAADSARVEINDSLDDIPVSMFNRRLDLPDSTRITYEDNRLSAAASCTSSTRITRLSHFPFLGMFTFNGDSHYGIELDVTLKPEFPYTADSVREFRRIHRNLRRYRL